MTIDIKMYQNCQSMWIPSHDAFKNRHLDLEKKIDFNVVDKVGWTVQHACITY